MTEVIWLNITLINDETPLKHPDISFILNEYDLYVVLMG